MANPSTGFGGAGTEVLRRSYVDGAGETESTILTGVANHIMTIISIVFCERANYSDVYFKLYIDADLSSNDCYLMQTTHLPAMSTFIWNDRITLTETDKLIILGASAANAANIDVWCTYIDQQLA